MHVLIPEPLLSLMVAYGHHALNISIRRVMEQRTTLPTWRNVRYRLSQFVPTLHGLPIDAHVRLCYFFLYVLKALPYSQDGRFLDVCCRDQVLTCREKGASLVMLITITVCKR